MPNWITSIVSSVVLFLDLRWKIATTLTTMRKALAMCLLMLIGCSPAQHHMYQNTSSFGYLTKYELVSTRTSQEQANATEDKDDQGPGCLAVGCLVVLSVFIAAVFLVELKGDELQLPQPSGGSPY